MSQHQKENIISLFSLLTASTVYIAYIFNRFSNSSFTPEEELKYWAAAFLLIIPIRIGIQILMYIFFKIAEGIVSNGKIKLDIKDERDKIVELKGNGISSSVFIIGFAISMFLIVFFNSTISAMFALIFIAGYVGELVGIIAKSYFYRKGV
jgi:hypothetical protein